jgi:peptidoglycan/LPS O-acetylase OafA/YrhL
MDRGLEHLDDMLAEHRREHWLALDGLRGVACLAVMFYHFIPFDTPRSHLAHALLWTAHAGWAGVDLFFVLSGFLITDILLREKGAPALLETFYARRILRIFPLYYAVLFATLVAAPVIMPRHLVESMRDTIDHQGWLWTYAYNIRIVFTGKFWADSGIPLSHVWSLAVEEHFYLFWPLFVLRAGRATLRRFAIGAVVVVPLVRTALVLAGASRAIVYSFTPCRMDSLLFGALIALTCQDLRYSALLKRLAPRVLVASFAAFLFLAWLGGSPSGLRGPMASVGFTVIGLGSAAIVVLAIGPERSLLKQALETSVLRWFGRYSYGAYVLHLLFQPALEHWLPPARLEGALASQTLAIMARAALGICSTMVAAVASFHLLEAPFLRFARLFAYGVRLPQRVAGPLPSPSRP